jgi:peptidoglycan/LPS O-acetylase OafA/YrhL
MRRRWIQAISITNDRDTNDFPKHLHTLDILRGLASLAVVLYHYQHFYYVAPGALAPGFVWSALPLYSLFWPFYQWGFLAVKVFFVLSGFVFILYIAMQLRPM